MALVESLTGGGNAKTSLSCPLEPARKFPPKDHLMKLSYLI